MHRTGLTGPLPASLRADEAALLQALRRDCAADATRWDTWRDLVEHRPFTTTYRDHGDAQLVVVHAALPYANRERTSRRTRDLCLYGEVLGRDGAGRAWHGTEWAATWPARGVTVVHGHVAQRQGGAPCARGATLNLDTGCAYGGALSAFRWPDAVIVQVPASRSYYRDNTTARPATGQREHTPPRPKPAEQPG